MRLLEPGAGRPCRERTTVSMSRAALGDRDHQAPAGRELGEQARGRLGSARVHRDRLVGPRPRRPALAVADDHLHVPDIEVVEHSAGSFTELGTRSMLITRLASSAQNGRRVAGAGTDLEHVLVAAQPSAWQIAATTQGWEMV